MMSLNTDALSAHYRGKSIDIAARRLLITNFRGTEQEEDLTEPPNCDGFGRIRHFRRRTSPGWPSNPLPIDPALKALGINASDEVRAQVFQNSVCNWRCWYCFVPFNLLSADRRHSEWLTPAQLIDLYLEEEAPPPIIDLTGGQPDLVPEWIPWMMQELRDRGMDRRTYLWSDDNLSNSYFWEYLTGEERERIACYKNYGRVGCFKGFNAASFAFNTLADPDLFDRQFNLMSKFLDLGIDMYAYVTFTTPDNCSIRDDMRRFVERLQMLDEFLPLRTVPLEISVFTPVMRRLNETNRQSLSHQWAAVEAWQTELEDRFSSEMRSLPLTDVPLSRRDVQN